MKDQTNDMSVKCSDCGSLLPSETAASKEKLPCPKCGSIRKEIRLSFEDKVNFHERLHGKGEDRTKSSKDNPRVDFIVGDDLRKKDNKWMKKLRVIDKDKNLYMETVSNPEINEIVHHCEEPLSDHQGHGSAKSKKGYMNTSINDYKNNLGSLSLRFVEVLKDFNKLADKDLNDEKLKESLKNIGEVLYKGVGKIQKSIDFSIKHAQWDTLNIACFGETNAGKSTLIEALIKGNGSSIGEGLKDNTKKVSFFKHGKVNLLDMPGIEGKEYRFVNQIREAVEKSHVVFYVIEPKEPEDETLKKIKSYLHNRAKVFSVVNCRGKTTYKYNKVLVDKNIDTISKRTKLKFKNILHGNYHDNFIIDAYLGFLAVGKPQQRFLKDKEKMLSLFDNISDLYEFSNLKKIENLIDSLSNKINIDIAASNTYKILRSMEVVMSDILREKKKFDEGTKEIETHLKSILLPTCSETILKYRKEAQDILNIEIEKIGNEITEIVNKGIDNGEEQKSIKKKINEIQESYKAEINKKLKSEMDGMKKEIEGEMERFKKRVSLSMDFLDIEGEFNVGAILEKIEIGIGYAFKEILDIGLSILGIVVLWGVNPILGALETVRTIVTKIWDWFFGDPQKRQREAKQKAFNDIKELKGKMKIEVGSKLEKEFHKIDNSIKEKTKEISLYINDIQKFSGSMNNKIEKFQEIRADLSIAICRYVLGDNVKLAYIDLALRKMFIIYDGHQEINKEIFGIDDISVYNSLNNLFENINVKIERESLVLQHRDEFIYRALTSLKKHLDVKYVRRVHA